MGLGKTVQVIAFLCSLLERSAISGPHIIVAPLSVIASWKKDMARCVGHTEHPLCTAPPAHPRPVSFIA